MKLKSIIPIFTAIIFILLVAFSANAQKSKTRKVTDNKEQKMAELKKRLQKSDEEIKAETQSDEDLMAELKKNVICTMLYENIMAKENNEWSLKQAKCGDSHVSTYLAFKKGNKELSIFVLDCKTPEQAKIVLHTTFGQAGFRLYKEFGDEGHKDSANINFIKGRLLVNVSFRHFDSDEIPKRFAGYALQAIEGQ